MTINTISLQMVNALLSSAIETTCEVTRTGKINEQIMDIYL